MMFYCYIYRLTDVCSKHSLNRLRLYWLEKLLQKPQPSTLIIHIDPGGGEILHLSCTQNYDINLSTSFFRYNHWLCSPAHWICSETVAEVKALTLIRGFSHPYWVNSVNCGPLYSGA